MLMFDILITSFTFSLVHVISVVYLNMQNIRRSNLVCLKFFIASFLIVFFTFLLIQKSYIALPIMLFLLPLCTFILYKLNIAESFALSIISDLAVFYGGLLTQALIYQSPYNLLFPDNLKYIVIKNLFFLLVLVVVIIISNYIRNRPYISKKMLNNNTYYIIVIVCIAVLSNTCILSSDNNAYKIFLVNFGFKACFFILLVFILSIHSKMRFEHLSSKYIQLVKYTKIIEEMYEILVSQKHDFSNILFSISGYVDDNRISELQEYLNRHVLKEYSKKLNNSFLSPLKYIQNPALKGIVFTKLNQAAMKNIKLYINIFDEIEVCSIEPTDLVRIIGILFDNAIEACENSPQNELHLGMESEKTHTSIIIGNTFFHLPDIKLICKRGYSTKGENRGYGLYNLKKMLSLYPHAHLKTTVCNDIFYQELIIMK